MSRYILRYSGPVAPAEQVRRIRSASKLRVIDESPKMLLVEGDDQDIRNSIADESGWQVVPERTVRVPGPRPKIKNSE
jgi:hypothetical protein